MVGLLGEQPTAEEEVGLVCEMAVVVVAEKLEPADDAEEPGPEAEARFGKVAAVPEDTAA